MKRQLYSLYRLYGKRWVRVSPLALPVKEARKHWSKLLDPVQLSFIGPQWQGVQYDVRQLPKGRNR